jgi:hypothetical protein
MAKIAHNSIALAGEFAVLSQLALRGFDANMTLGNTKSVDILVSDPKTPSMFKIEVKTSLVEKPSHDNLFGTYFYWMMSEKQELISDPNLFYCFVTIQNPTSTPEPLVHLAPKWYAVSNEPFLEKVPPACGSIVREQLIHQRLLQTRRKVLRGR